ncbi:hypothetical protein TMatcc_001649 [Talaromyces marneffei ATCC 18224]
MSGHLRNSFQNILDRLMSALYLMEPFGINHEPNQARRLSTHRAPSLFHEEGTLRDYEWRFTRDRDCQIWPLPFSGPYGVPLFIPYIAPTPTTPSAP